MILKSGYGQRSEVQTGVKIDILKSDNICPIQLVKEEEIIPTEDSYDEHVAELNVEMIQAISSLKFGTDMDEDKLPTEVLNLAINTLSSNSMTPEEEKLGSFTRSKLKRLSTWEEWAKAERKQIDQFHDLGMYGEAIDPHAMKPNAVVLRPHWQYAVKRDGT